MASLAESERATEPYRGDEALERLLSESQCQLDVSEVRDLIAGVLAAPRGNDPGVALPSFEVDALRVRIGTLEGLPVPVSRLDARLTTRGHELRLGPLELETLSSRWRGGVTLNVAATPPTASFDLAVDAVSLEKLPPVPALPFSVGRAQQVKLLGRWIQHTDATVASALELDASSQRVALSGLPARLGDVVLEDVNVRYRPASGDA